MNMSQQKGNPQSRPRSGAGVQRPGTGPGTPVPKAADVSRPNTSARTSSKGRGAADKKRAGTTGGGGAAGRKATGVPLVSVPCLCAQTNLLFGQPGDALKSTRPWKARKSVFSEELFSAWYHHFVSLHKVGIFILPWERGLHNARMP